MPRYDKDFFEKEVEQNFELILENASETRQLKVFTSLSEIPEIIKEVEILDVPRIAFGLMGMSKYVFLKKDKITQEIIHKLENIFNFVVENKGLVDDEIGKVFTSIYVLESAIFLQKNNSVKSVFLKELLESLNSIECAYRYPLLSNKVISFYENHKTEVDLSSMERLVGNLKSVMLYLISSDTSKTYPLFYFADMLVWSKGLACEEKVYSHILTMLADTKLELVSSSGLAYIVECFLRSGRDAPKEVLSNIENCRLTQDKHYLTPRAIPYGLYLNTKYENKVCLDTNVHLLLGSLYSEIYVRHI